MELRQLRYFLSAARHMSFTEAARECYVAQTTMSQQIRELERDLGVELFVRQNNTISLTPAGEQFQKDAARILLNVEQAEQKLYSLQNEAKQVFHIGYYGHGIGEHFPRIMNQILKNHTGVKIRFHQCAKEELLQVLEAGVVDCIINGKAENQQVPSWLASELICKSPMEITAAEGVFPIQDGFPLDLTEPLPLPMITLTSPVVRNVNEAAIRVGEKKLSVSNPIPTAQDVQLTVATGQAVFLGPKYARLDCFDLKHYPLKDFPVEMSIYLMWNRERFSPLITELLERSRQYFKALAL